MGLLLANLMGKCRQFSGCLFLLLQILLEQRNARLETERVGALDQVLVIGNFQKLALRTCCDIKHGQCLGRRPLIDKRVMILFETGHCMIFQLDRRSAKDLEALFQVSNMLRCLLLVLQKRFTHLSILALLRQLWQYLHEFLLNIVHGAQMIEKQILWTLHSHNFVPFVQVVEFF